MSLVPRPFPQPHRPATRVCLSQCRGCWVDLFDQPGFRGRRLRLFGPANYVNLYVAPEDWADEAASLVAGPNAYVQCFEELNFPASVVWILPGQRIAEVASLPADALVDSIRVFDRPPFASEPGYEAYVRAEADGPAPLRMYPDGSQGG